MGETELIKLLTAAGEVTALIIGAVFIVRALSGAFVRGAELWRDAARERNEANRALARALETIGDKMSHLPEEHEKTRTEIAGFRRETQVMHGSQTETLAAIAAGIDAMPGAVRAAMVADFERVGNALSDLRVQNVAQSTALDKALADWASTGAKLAQLIKPEPAKPSTAEVLAAARKVQADYDKRHTGDHAPVSADATTTDEAAHDAGEG